MMPEYASANSNGHPRERVATAGIQYSRDGSD